MTDLENNSPKRTPSMYHFYKWKIEEAIQTNSWGTYDALLLDVPDDIKQELILNGVLEESVEDSRREVSSETDGQPDAIQEWEDFGEIYDDEPEKL